MGGNTTPRHSGAVPIWAIAKPQKKRGGPMPRAKRRSARRNPPTGRWFVRGGRNEPHLAPELSRSQAWPKYPQRPERQARDLLGPDRAPHQGTRTPLSPATTMILWRIAVNWSQASGISDDPDRRSHGTSSTKRAGSRPAALRNRPSALFQAGWTEMRFRPIPGKQAAPVRSCETALGQSAEQPVLIAAERPAGDRDRAFFSR